MNIDEYETNGEALFFHQFVKPTAKLVFDIGCKKNTMFRNFEGQVHYFNPNKEIINYLTRQKNKNSKSVFNRFGLANIDGSLEYFPQYNSFVNHNHSSHSNTLDLQVRKAESYIKFHGIGHVDFVRISADGLELQVLKGFGNFLQYHVHIVEFKYGKQYLYTNTKLSDIIQYLHGLGFYDFSYVTKDGLSYVTYLHDTYEDANIVCVNKNV